MDATEGSRNLSISNIQVASLFEYLWLYMLFTVCHHKFKNIGTTFQLIMVIVAGKTNQDELSESEKKGHHSRLNESLRQR